MNSWVTRFLQLKPKAKVQSGKKSRKSHTANTGHANHPFRAVTVYSRENCCQAAKRLKGQRFLANHAPVLPLGGCTQPNQCHCRYRHLTDRREEMRRDTDFGLPGRGAGPQGERRSRRDRRVSAR